MMAEIRDSINQKARLFIRKERKSIDKKNNFMPKKFSSKKSIIYTAKSGIEGAQVGIKKLH